MNNIKFNFIINGTEWNKAHLERMEYERNLHMLHSMKRHGLEVADGEHTLSDDEIDYLTSQKAWEVSIAVRKKYTGQQIQELYKSSFDMSDAMWKSLPFDQNKPMKASYCGMSVEGISLQEFMKVFQMMQADEGVLFASHPEHFATIVTDEKIIGIEPFGAYGTPTLCKADVVKPDELGPQIQADIDASYPISMGGRAYLSDGVIEINSPFHQLKPTENGFEAKLAVYWPEGVVDEIVEGHALHLAMEFYEALRLAVKLKENA